MDHAERACALFLEGYNCAQAVVCAYHEEMGLTLAQAAKLASGFGGGMGGLRDTCGAVSGMCMALSAIAGYDTPGDLAVKTAHYARVRALAQAFAEAQGSCVCRELLASLPGKLSENPSERTPAYYRERPCARLVACAAQLLEDALVQGGELQSTSAREAD